jgi:hypothetical protein
VDSERIAATLSMSSLLPRKDGRRRPPTAKSEEQEK